MKQIFTSAADLPTKKEIDRLAEILKNVKGTDEEMTAMVDLYVIAKKLLGLIERLALPKKVFAVRLSGFDIEYCPMIGYQDIDTTDPKVPIGNPATCEISIHMAGRQIRLGATAISQMSLGEFAAVADELQRDDRKRAYEIQIREVEVDES